MADSATGENQQRRGRESILSVAAKWLPWCLGLVFALTLAWAVFVARVEITSGDHESASEVVVAVAIKTAATSPLIFLCSLFVTTVLDLSGGPIMVTARYLTDKFLEPWREKRKAEFKAEIMADIRADLATRIPVEVRAEIEAQGMARGLAQKQREWEVWLREKEDADERGEPFDEPPPSL